MLNRQIIYEAPQEKFFKDVLGNRFTDIVRDNFKEIYGRQTHDSEFMSWSATAYKIKNLLEIADLTDIYVSFEYQVPYTQKRIDCLLFGKSNADNAFLVHIELKQWQKVDALETRGNFVETYTGGHKQNVVHPSQQVKGYHEYLIGFVEAFEKHEIDLMGCSYCINYKKTNENGLFNPIYKSILDKYPVYTQEDLEILAKKLRQLLGKGDGFKIFNKFMQSPVRPSKKLLESASKIVTHEAVFSLLDDQIYAKNIILDKIKKAEDENEKNVVIVKGGPGTGKTVIALHILAEMAAQHKTLFFSSKSKPLIEAIRHQLEQYEARMLFSNLNPFVPSRIGANELDILIVDEAHRIGKTSNHQFTRPRDRTSMPQVEQLVRCAKTVIFFIDDKQVIRFLEVGNTDLIKEAAGKYGCNVEEFELTSQFRCAGSNNYLEWLESVLGHSERKMLFDKKSDDFDFQIVSSPKKLYEMVKEKDSVKGQTARLTAGFCWNWSRALDANGELVRDVKIGDFALPWETHEKITPPRGYVRWYEWAYKPEGIKQVGCIYTAQGFEFDYIGVIVGNDLRYDESTDSLTGNIDGTRDPVLRRSTARFDEYVRNIYRVLMSRGLKGCYVFFVDKDVEQYFKARIKQ